MHFGEGDDFLVAEHAERVIKPGSSDLGSEPLSPCCAEQGPAKFQLPLPVDHGQAEPTAPDEDAVGASVGDPLPDPIGLPLPSHLCGCGCRLFRRPGIGPVGDVGVAVHQEKIGRVLWTDRVQYQPRRFDPHPRAHPIVRWVAISREASRSRRFNGPQPNPEFRLQKSSGRAARCKPTG
jgi:hypothetical protein